MGDNYLVRWTEKATIILLNIEEYEEVEKYRINSKYVFKRSRWVLGNNPAEQGLIIDRPNFEFYGHYWVKLEGVIILYMIHDDTKEVVIDACFHARSKDATRIYDIDPDS